LRISSFALKAHRHVFLKKAMKRRCK